MSKYSYGNVYTRDEKKEALVGIVREAWHEQFTEARHAKRDRSSDPFEVRAFRTDRIDKLIDVLKGTDALELLAEMVGAIDEEVE